MAAYADWLHVECGKNVVEEASGWSFAPPKEEMKEKKEKIIVKPGSKPEKPLTPLMMYKEEHASDVTDEKVLREVRAC